MLLIASKCLYWAHSSENKEKTTVKIIEFSAFDGQLLNQVECLRATAWNAQVQMQVFKEGRWSDSHDSHAYHWAVLSHTNEVVASARLCLHRHCEEFPDFEDLERLIPLLPLLLPTIGMMNRLVVHPDFQRRGLARKLDELRIEKAIQANCRSMMVAVPEYRRKAIKSLGFRFVGKVIDKSLIRESHTDFYLYTKDLRLA